MRQITRRDNEIRIPPLHWEQYQSPAERRHSYLPIVVGFAILGLSGTGLTHILNMLRAPWYIVTMVDLAWLLIIAYVVVKMRHSHVL